jgi:hypothetical protein
VALETRVLVTHSMHRYSHLVQTQAIHFWNKRNGGGGSAFVISVVFSLVSWGEARLVPLGTSATNWPIVPAPDDR